MSIQTLINIRLAPSIVAVNRANEKKNSDARKALELRFAAVEAKIAEYRRDHGLRAN